MGFRGKIAVISLQQIISVLHEGKRSGVLVIQKDDLKTRVIFRFGEMIHGVSTAHKENIFDYFIDQGIFSREYILDQCSEKSPNLSSLVQDLSASKKHEIVAALQGRAIKILYEALFWEKGSYEFIDRDE